MAASSLIQVYALSGTRPDGSTWLNLLYEFGGLGAPRRRRRARRHRRLLPRRTLGDPAGGAARGAVLRSSCARRACLPDSGGPGAWRGGLGVETVIELLDDARLTVRGDRLGGHPPPGARGGERRPPGLVLDRAGRRARRGAGRAPDRRAPRRRATASCCEPRAAAAWGPPRERDAALVRDDIVTGKVTPEGRRPRLRVRRVTADGWVLGADVGGTFTDLVLTDDTGTVHTAKVPTTPVDPIDGIVRGVAEVLADARCRRRRRGRASCTARRSPPTSILQRTGAPVALVTTEGFADLLRLGREARVEEDRYDLHFTPAPPPVDPRLTFEVRERIDASGAVLVPLTDPAIDAVVAQVAGEAPAGVAVCLLHSYAASRPRAGRRERTAGGAAGRVRRLLLRGLARDA